MSDTTFQERAEHWKSQLPTWQVERVELEGEASGDHLWVTCPRKGCGQWFIVKLAWCKKRTANCPHCLKVSIVPKLPRRITK